MSDTFNLDDYLVREKTIDMDKLVEFECIDLDVGDDVSPIVLIGKFAGIDYNRALRNAQARKYADDDPVGEMTEEAEAARAKEMVIDLWPEYVLVGWKFKDHKGNNVNYTMNGARQVLRRLNVYEFNKFCRTFGDPENFKKILTKEKGVMLGNESGGRSRGKRKTVSACKSSKDKDQKADTSTNE